MELKALQAEMIKALKAGQKERKESNSQLVTAVKKAAIDAGCRDNVPEDMVDAAILKEVKSAKEQVDTCPASRTDLLEQYKAHLAVIEEFAPKQLSAEEVKALLTEKYAEVIASKNRGLIMKTVMADLKGKADGKVISAVVGELCK